MEIFFNISSYLYNGQDYETVARDTDRDNFMTAQAAKEYGLVDQVLSFNKENFTRMDFNIRCLTTETTQWLMNHDTSIF
jgi:hypothetical protein